MGSLKLISSMYIMVCINITKVLVSTVDSTARIYSLMLTLKLERLGNGNRLLLHYARAFEDCRLSIQVTLCPTEVLSLTIAYC